ncbi:MAG: sensor histidine kinase [Bacteriovoracia bacterium]
MMAPEKNELIAHRAEEIFALYYKRIAKKTDQIFCYLFIAQWLGGIALAFLVSPLSWAGAVSQTHIHVYAAIFVGGILATLPVYLYLTQPGEPLNRYVNAVAQIFFSILFIHLTGGRIETHFHIFGSLAFLAFYRDWKIVALATLITAADHMVRGMFWPESVYGVISAGMGRALEHSAWVIFEDTVLFFSIKNGLRELRSNSEKQAALEQTIASVEDVVNSRTEELVASRQLVIDQQQALLSVAKMSALGEMAGGVAHEINNPLAIIKAVSAQLEEVMQDESIDKALVVRMSETISKTADRIAKIVFGLRTFSRDGSLDPFRPVNVMGLIENTVGLCSERFRNHGVELKIGDCPRELMFEGRETQISQVLLNLLNNAYDAIAERENKWVKISVSELESEIKISVTDCGNGIPPDIQKKIFQPFFTTKEIGKGTGMGLSISLGIMDAHKGVLALDHGSPNTAFVLTLPKKYASSREEKAA